MNFALKYALKTVEANKGSIGVGLGFMLGCSVSKIVADREKNDPSKIELLIEDGDILRMTEDNQIGIYDTPKGPMYVSMNIENLQTPEE